jgi:3D (Asp-Asp-Asp) domain-containing protein
LHSKGFLKHNAKRILLQNGRFNLRRGVIVFVVLSVGIFCIIKAMTNGVVFLRTTMPSESAVSYLSLQEGDFRNAPAGSEQILIQRLFQDYQEIIPKPTENPPLWRLVRMRVTAYCPCEKCCGQFADGITASNHEIQPDDRFVAADKTYRFGTEMVIRGYNRTLPVKVLDRGGAIKDNRLDVFFPTHEIALEWGVREMDVLVREN